MCSEEDLLKQAGWDGVHGVSRHQLLVDLQRTSVLGIPYIISLSYSHAFLLEYIPPSVMIPPRRMEALLQQAQAFQRNTCLYHNTSTSFSLYSDHECDRTQFPSLTTYILAEHDDEVWHIKWSHSGQYLASASKDKSAIVWRIGVSLSVLPSFNSI